MGAFQYTDDGIKIAYHINRMRDHSARDAAVNGIVEIGPPAVPALIKALKDENSYVRWGAALALGKIAEANLENADVVKAVPALIGALNDENMDVREKAAETLGKIGIANLGTAGVIVPALVGALKDEGANVGIKAARALMEIAKANPENAEVVKSVPALVLALKDGNQDVANWAVRALAKIGLHAVPALVVAIKDANWNVRRRAVWALGRIARANPSTLDVVVPALVGALKDEKSDVRGRASQALGKIAVCCETIEPLEAFEKMLKEGVALLVKGSTSKDEVRDAMMNIAGLINTVASRKNELARKEMEADGLILAGERPKPPKKNEGMYQAARKQAARCG